MTPKEDIKKALDGLAQFIIMNDTGTDESASAIEWHGILKQALTPPTEQEVCKALSEETGNSVYYENGKFYVHSVLWHNALSLDTLSKKSISLIGRFYDGLEKEEKE